MNMNFKELLEHCFQDEQKSDLNIKVIFWMLCLVRKNTNNSKMYFIPKTFSDMFYILRDSEDALS